MRATLHLLRVDWHVVTADFPLESTTQRTVQNYRNDYKCKPFSNSKTVLKQKLQFEANALFVSLHTVHGLWGTETMDR